MITNFLKNLWNKLFPKKQEIAKTTNDWTPSKELQAYIKSSINDSPVNTPAPIEIIKEAEIEPVIIEPQIQTIEISNTTSVAENFEEHATSKKAPIKKATTKKAATKKTPLKKAPAKKASIKKAPVKKTPAKKTTNKTINKTTKNKK